MDPQSAQLHPVSEGAATTHVPAPESLKLQEWDPAVFSSDILLARTNNMNFTQNAKAMSAQYGKIMMALQSHFDVAGFEPSLEPERKLDDNKRLYQFSTDNNYPPHLSLVPKDVAVTKENLFQSTEKGKKEFPQVEAAVIIDKLGWFGKLFNKIRPGPHTINTFRACSSFAQIQANQEAFRDTPRTPSVGDLATGKDAWYTDAMFAQQNFTGINPSTIKLAKEWKQKFLSAAQTQKLDKHVQLLKDTNDSSLYVQDYSYFREAFGVSDKSDDLSVGGGGIFARLRHIKRWACAAVTLYTIDNQGRLHPFAIVTDYKGSMEDSVVIFNQRLTADNESHDQANDWPWRYAKTCSQVSDWIRHEVAIHLTEAHLVEEALIVAASRTLPPSHIVFNILSPHWDKTLSLNAAARAVLVPSVIVPIIGVSEEQVSKFVNYSYTNFDFEGKYIPTDLENRGFPLKSLGDLRCHCSKNCTSGLDASTPCTAGCGKECHQPCDPKFINYTYGRNMKLLWDTLRTFVKGYLATAGYTEDDAGDKRVQNDTYIQDWVKEVHSPKGANLRKFPTITTAKSLIDAVTMCIHIASPQHTAVNYLQQYYLSFVVNKPPALCAAPPSSLRHLKGYGEKDVIEALPVAANRDAEWLLASHLPALLSQTVSKDLNLVAYAVNVYNLARLADDKSLIKVTSDFCRDLWTLGDTFDVGDQNRSPKKGIFTLHSEELVANGFPAYSVMDPVVTAVSILI